MLTDYGYSESLLTVYCDSTSAINISRNPVQHSRTKHIDIHYHFISELVDSGALLLTHVSSESQLVELFTEAPVWKTFTHLRNAIGVCIPSSVCMS